VGTGTSSQSYPTTAQFADVLRTQLLSDVVDKYVFSGQPYIFRSKPKALEALRSHVCRDLKLQPENIIVVGSAKIGFSLDPNTYFQKFNIHSDIDVLVVDSELFDLIWLTLIKWNYPKRWRLEGADWSWAKKRRDEVYWGWFQPDDIRLKSIGSSASLKSLRDVSRRWFNAFRSLAKRPEFAARDVSGRLYRTWEHARLYQASGLAQIRDKLAAGL